MSKIRTLFLAANPKSTTQLALDEEIRAITQKIRLSDGRDVLEVISTWAVRPDDLLQYLNQYKPQIVHFSGHGSDTGEIILVDNVGQAKPVSTNALKALFKTLKDNVQIVVLNACYSRQQAEAIAEVIDYVVGMNTSIGDEAAIVFAASFYRALGFSRSIQEAFDQAKTALLLEGIPEENTPELLFRKDVDPASVYLVDVQRKGAIITRVVPLTTDTLNSLHELDNAIRKTVGPLTRFDHTTWSHDARETAIKEMGILADTEVILPKVRQLMAQLEGEKAKGFDVSSEGIKTVDAVLACGRATLESLGESNETPWSGPRELNELMYAIRYADSPDAAESVRQVAQKVLAVVDRKLLREADELLGHFKGIMLD
jgi:hypothetical protein